MDPNELTPEEDKAEQERFEQQAAEAEGGEPPANQELQQEPPEQQDGGDGEQGEGEGDDESARLWAEMQAEEEGNATPSTDGDGGDKDSTTSVSRGTGDGGEGKSGDRPSSEASPPADPWQNAPPELRAAHEAEVKRLRAEAERAVRREQGRRRKEQEQGTKRPPAETAARPSPPASKKPVGEFLDEALTDYPEIREPLKQTLAPIEQKLDQLERAEAARIAQAKEREEAAEVARIKGQQELLDQAHPDWEKDIVYGKHARTFYDWINDPIRPRKFYDAVFKTNNERIVDAKAAIEVFDAFKKEIKLAQEPPASRGNGGGQRQELSARRAAQRDGARSPRSPGGPPLRSGIPAEGDPQAIWDQIASEDPEEAKWRKRA